MGAGTAAKNYDGTNDFATRGGGLTGAADGTECTIFFWVKPNGGDGSAQIFLGSDPAGEFRIVRLGTNKLRFVVDNDSGTTWLSITSSSDLKVANGWTPVICAFDGSNGYIYFGDTQEATGTPNGTNADWTKSDWGWGARPDTGGFKANACFSEIWVDDNFIDPTLASNRRKFFDASGNPVELGTNGENPNGASPLIYAPDGDPSTNAGTGGNFTITGALTDCADTPGVSETIVTVGLVTQTHTALSVGVSKSVTAGLASETDTAFSVSGSKVRSVGLAQETGTALPVTADRTYAMGLPQETDSALSATPNRTYPVGLASETDSALAVTGAKNLGVGLASETDTAFPVTVVASQIITVGLAQETDTAFPINISKTMPVGLAIETDTANPVQTKFFQDPTWYVARGPTDRRVPLDVHIFDEEI